MTNSRKKMLSALLAVSMFVPTALQAPYQLMAEDGQETPEPNAAPVLLQDGTILNASAKDQAGAFTQPLLIANQSAQSMTIKSVSVDDPAFTASLSENTTLGPDASIEAVTISNVSKLSPETAYPLILTVTYTLEDSEEELSADLTLSVSTCAANPKRDENDSPVLVLGSEINEKLDLGPSKEAFAPIRLVNTHEESLSALSIASANGLVKADLAEDSGLEAGASLDLVLSRPEDAADGEFEDGLTISYVLNEEPVSETLKVSGSWYSDPEVKKVAITFLNEDGSELKQVETEFGQMPVYDGDLPEKAADDDFTWTFAGWSPALAPADGETAYTAVFEKTPRAYALSFELNGGKAELSETYIAGQASALPTPEKALSRFEGWYDNPDFEGDPISSISEETRGDKKLYAKWYELAQAHLKARDFTLSSAPEGSISNRGSIPVENTGETKATITSVSVSDKNFTVTAPANKVIEGGHTASLMCMPNAALKQGDYTSVVSVRYTVEGSTVEKVLTFRVSMHVGEPEGKTYAIQFIDYNGRLLEIKQVKEGEMPQYTAGRPASFVKDHTRFTFMTWTPALKRASGPATYKAVYVETPEEYVCRLNPDNGEAVSSFKFHYNDNRPLGIPEKAGYTFVGWYVLETIDGQEQMTGEALENANQLDGTVTLKAKWEKNVSADLSADPETVEFEERTAFFEDSMNAALQIANGGDGTAVIDSVASDADWLIVPVVDEKIEPDGTAELTLETAKALNEGSYSGTITITYHVETGALKNTQKTLVIPCSAKISVEEGTLETESTLNFEELVGKDYEPVSKDLVLKNASKATVLIDSMTADQDLLDFETAEKAGPESETVLKVSPKAGLKAGTYEGTLEIDWHAQGSLKNETLSVPYSFTISVLPAALEAAEALEFDAASEKHYQAPEAELKIENTSAGTAVITAVETPDWVDAGVLESIAGNESGSLKLSVKKDLPRDTYTGTLVIRYVSDGDETEKTLSVALSFTVAYETESYVIRFLNWDGTVLQEEEIEENELPAYKGETPVKEQDDLNTYTFKSWDKEYAPATEAADYTAMFVSVPRSYKITYKANGGSVSGANEYKTDTGSLLPVPKKTNARFDGWYRTPDFKGEAVNMIKAGTSGDVTLYARWTEYVAMQRLYNPYTGEHFYTANLAERDNLVRLGWRYENIAWYAPVHSSIPVYRLFNPYSDDHHYTMSAAERDSLTKIGWIYEGIGWYSDEEKGQVLYRLFNPNVFTGSHHYTVSSKERDDLVRVGWRDEQYAWYGVKVR